MTTNTNTGLAYDFTATLAALMDKYQTTSQLKKEYKKLVNNFGKDEALRLMHGFRDARAAEAEAVADEARCGLTTAGVMEYAFSKLDKGKSHGALARLQSMGKTERAAEWDSFLGKYYPHTLTDGRPARSVWYTKDGNEVFKVYEPVSLTPDTAIKVLNKALDNLERGASKVWSTGKERKGYTTQHSLGVIEQVCSAKIVHEVLRNEAGDILKDTYKVERGEQVEFPEGLKLTSEYMTVNEFNKTLNVTEE